MKDEQTKDIVEKEGTPPVQMIREAIAKGADLEKLDKLLTLQERWEANEARKQYHQAMAQFKANPPKITKDKEVKYKEVKYKHASLANVVDQITKELSKHGLSASWRTNQNGDVIVTCMITHQMGHSEETSLSASADSTGSKNSIQAIGSTITYLQRYTLLSMLGLATGDQDDDGRGSEVVHITEEQVGKILDILDNLPDSKDKKPKFLNYMNVEKVSEIPAGEYDRAMQALIASRDKAVQQ